MVISRLVLIVVVIWAVAAARPVRSEMPERPNFLVILADDLGFGDVGYHGSEIITPNIDRLAGSGVRLEQHYVMPTCSPTRAGLLSGRYPSRFGLTGPTNSRVFAFGMPTLASALGSRGYETGITGKWHLGSKPEWGPLKFGFDHSHGSLAGGVDQYEHVYKYGQHRQTWHRNDRYIEQEGHTTDLFAQEAIGWIKTARQPFFIYVAFTAVHIPLQEPDSWVELYDGKIEDPSRRLFAACATHMDAAIGRMVEALEETGRRGNTLIVFSSDNGAQRSWLDNTQYQKSGEHVACSVLGNNRPLRGWKGGLYEGGIRVPAFVNWPGVLKPGKCNVPVHIVDWFPTLARLAGYEPDESLELDGRDVWPLLTGKQKRPAPRTLYWKTRVSALRHGDWKLIDRGKKVELFNLAEDPYEETDLGEEYPQRVAELKALIAEQQKRDRPRIKP